MRLSAAFLLALVCATTARAQAASPAGGFLDRYRREAAPADRIVTTADPSRLRILDQYTYRRTAKEDFVPEDGIELAFVMDSRSPWESTEAGRAFLLTELDKTATILKQCSVRLDAVTVSEAWMSDDLRRALTMDAANPYDPPAEVQAMAALSAPLRPLTLLIGDGYTHAFNRDAVDGLVQQYPSASSLLNVVALSWQIAAGYEHDFQTQPSYSILAHELVHVLGNVGHVDTPQANLMNSYVGATPKESGQAKSGDLLPSQCEAIRRYKTPAPGE